MKTSILQKTILKLLKTGHARNIHTLADRVHPADMAATLEVLDPESIKLLFDQISDNKIVARIIATIKDKETASKTFGVLKRERICEILNLINPDDSADLVGFLPSKDASAILKLLKKETSIVLNGLLKYAPNTAGGIMNTKYIILDKKDAVIDAVRELKANGHTGPYINIYIKNQKQELCGIIPVSNLFSYPSDTPLSKIMDDNPVLVKVNLHQSKVINIFNRYGIIETAVVDKDKKMLGIITSDDIATRTEKEASKDVQEISGSLSVKNPLKARFLMATISFILISISSYVILNNLRFLNTQLIELLCVFPLLIILPALLAFQSSSSTSRDFDIGLLETSSFFSIIKLEFKIGLAMGLFFSAMLGTVLFLYFGNTIKDHAVIVVCFFVNIVASCIFGGIIPFIFRKKNHSYIAVSAPVIISISAIISASIYLALSIYLLSIDIIPNSWKIF